MKENLQEKEYRTMGKLFTSESVIEGDPDKTADQISDAILNAYIAQDPHARVAAETTVTCRLSLEMIENDS